VLSPSAVVLEAPEAVSSPDDHFHLVVEECLAITVARDLKDAVMTGDEKALLMEEWKVWRDPFILRLGEEGAEPAAGPVLRLLEPFSAQGRSVL
jgi:hypothetical protein